MPKSLSLVKGLSLVIMGWGITLTSTPQLVKAQQDFEQVQIESIPVKGGIYMLVGEGGNIGVSAGEDGIFLIDDQYAPLTEKIVKAVAAISQQPIRFLINTHWHPDHTGGNENLGKSGTIIVAHDRVREKLSAKQFIEALDMKIPAASPAGLPTITFNDTTTFYLNGNTIQVFHVLPAHTDGDSVIHFREANVIHAGDIYFNGIYPFIDVSSGGSLKGTIAAAKRILSLCDGQTKIIPGHGNLASKKELENYIAMLETVQKRVQAAIDRGMSAEDFIASKPTADLDETWGKGFLNPAQFLQIVYSDLSR